MGNILNIRLMAQTLNEEDVAGAWPALCTLVWPDWMYSLKLSRHGLDKLVGLTRGAGPVEKFFGKRRHGVVELASDLDGMLRFGELPENVAAALAEPVKLVSGINRDLARALADWVPQEANSLSNKLEDALDRAEKTLAKLINSAGGAA